MNTKKFIILYLPIVILLTACDNNEKPQEPEKFFVASKYYNDKAVVCGVKDPVKNNDWLYSIHYRLSQSFDSSCVKFGYYYEYSVSVYENNETKEQCFVIKTNITGDPEYYYYEGYDCSNNSLFHDGYWVEPKDSVVSLSPSVGQKQSNKNISMQCPVGPRRECIGCDEFFETHTFLYDLVRYECLPVK